MPAGNRRKRKTTATAPCRSCGSSIRSTAPAPISLAGTTGRFRSRSSSDGRPLIAAIYVPVTDEIFLRGCMARAPTSMAFRSRSGGATLDGARAARSQTFPGSLVRPSRRAYCRSPGCIHWRCGLPALHTASSMQHRQRQPRLGPCSRRSFGARSRRRADRYCGRAAHVQWAGSRIWRAGRRRSCAPRRLDRARARPRNRIRVGSANREKSRRGSIRDSSHGCRFADRENPIIASRPRR